MMKDNGYITPSQEEQAAAAPLVVARQGIESADAPYFVDMVNERLSEDFNERDFQDTGYRVYTTIDMDLQRDAAEAVAVGMQRTRGHHRETKRRTAHPPIPRWR